MKLSKRIFALVLCLIMVLAMSACGKRNEPVNSELDPAPTPDPEEQELEGEITFWHFNKDEGPALADAFMKANPKVTVKCEVTADTDGAYQTKVQTASRGGNLPDVYAAENAFVKRFVNMPGGYAPMDFVDVEEIKAGVVPYTAEIGTNPDGKLVALSHQSCAGAIGYKRDLAKQYLGTDDPNEVAKMLTKDKLLETARTVKEKSGGKAHLFVGIEDLFKIYLGSREHAWIEDNKFVMDPSMDQFIDLAKTMRDEGLDGGIKQWTPEWSAAVQDDINMCYAVPTWGVNWIVDVNESTEVRIMEKDDDPRDNPGTGGRWGLTTPIPYYEGGTWFGISQNSKNKELAWEFIKFLASNEDFLNAQAQAGDVVSNKNVIDKCKNDDALLNKVVNQNVYAVFGPMLDGINGKIVTEYDDTCKMDFLDSLNTFLAGEIDKDTMLKQFKEKLSADLQGKNITVE